MSSAQGINSRLPRGVTYMNSWQYSFNFDRHTPLTNQNTLLFPNENDPWQHAFQVRKQKEKYSQTNRTVLQNDNIKLLKIHELMDTNRTEHTNAKRKKTVHVQVRENQCDLGSISEHTGFLPGMRTDLTLVPLLV